MTWGVLLEGHAYDLDDWKNSLKAPFDPHVIVVDISGVDADAKDHVLLADAFCDCTNADEVRTAAVPLVRQLNALMAILNKSHPLMFHTIVKLNADGTFHTSRYLSPPLVENRSHVYAPTVTGGVAREPEPSFPQQAIGKSIPNLNDALDHFSRADNWHDLYKAFEAIEDHVGGRPKLTQYGAARADVVDFAMTANVMRHHKGPPPARTLNLEEGRQFIAALLRRLLS